MQLAFTPGPSGTIAATDTSQAITLAGGGSNLYVYNESDDTVAYIAVGDASVTTTASAGTTGTGGGMAVGPRAYFVFGMGRNATSVAAICATGETAILHFTRGDGE